MFLGSKLNYTKSPVNEISWLKGIPPDKPACGFTGELCIEGTIVILNSKILIYCDIFFSEMK